jgi:hypothetical protein
VGYERGAGVWIGASLRAGDRVVVHHLRERLRMLRSRSHTVDRALAFDLARGLVTGLARGLLLSPWPRATAPTR